jgi:hypothetical protein
MSNYIVNWLQSPPTAFDLIFTPKMLYGLAWTLVAHPLHTIAAVMVVVTAYATYLNIKEVKV